MKNTDRVRKNRSVSGAASQAQTVSALDWAANSQLEPELLEIAAAWSAKKRLAVAKKFLRWSSQLKASTPGENRAPKIPRGYVLVNLSSWEQKDMRNLARECGYDLRSVLRWALNDIRSLLKAKVDIKQKTGMDYCAQARFFGDFPAKN